MKKSDIDPTQVAQEVIKNDQNQRHALRVLLDAQSEKDGHLLACRSRMGNTTSYITSVPLEWVANKIGFAGDLPIFTGKVDPVSRKIPIDEVTIGYIQQRPPNWSRQISMTMYLAMREYHKFPPLLVVAYQPWVYETDEQWSAGIAIKDSINADPLDHKGFFFDLDCADTQYYALDGQHRLMAILGLRDLLKNKRLSAKNKDGSEKRRCITLEDVSKEFERMGKEKHASLAAFQNIFSERIGVEIIPAVTRGETYRDALFRLRNVFVDVNENAQKIQKGEAHQLDEEEGFRIVARSVTVTNNLLKNKTDIEKNQLPDTSDKYTTLDAVVKIATRYLGQLEDFSGWRNPLFGVSDFGYIRPDDEELRNATTELNRYFDALSTLPSHKRLIDGMPAGKIRRAPEKDDDKSREYEDNVLFRPIAQMALADALGSLVAQKEMSLEDIIKTISRQEEKGQLKLSDRKAPWFGVLCDPYGEGKMRRPKKFQDLASRLFVYLLGGGYDTKEEQEGLREDLWESRCVENEAYDFNGEKVTLEKFHLPAPWR